MRFQMWDYREGAHLKCLHIPPGLRARSRWRHRRVPSDLLLRRLSKRQCSLASGGRGWMIWAAFLPVSTSKRFPQRGFKFSLIPYFHSSHPQSGRTLKSYMAKGVAIRMKNWGHKCSYLITVTTFESWLLTSWVTLGKWINPSVPQLPPL